MVLYVTWDMPGFSHEFLITWERAAKSVYDKNLSIPYFFQAIRTSVPSNFHPMVCYIPWMVFFFSYEFPITWLNSVKGLIKWEKPGILITILFSRYGLLSFRRTPVPWNTEKRHPPIFTLFSEYVSFHIKFRPNGPESTMYKQHLALINGTRKVFEYFLNISYPL